MKKENFLRGCKEIIFKNREVFQALEDYDKTNKITKAFYRERINFTIDESLLREFKKYCKDRGYNMSRLIEKYIKQELKKQ
jgi:predicted DNA binding CopG/RHH family protein